MRGEKAIEVMGREVKRQFQRRGEEQVGKERRPRDGRSDERREETRQN